MLRTMQTPENHNRILFQFPNYNIYYRWANLFENRHIEDITVVISLLWWIIVANDEKNVRQR